MRVHPKYLIPNGFTALSMMIGLGSIAASATAHFTLAAWMILWGMLLDKLDGTSARLLKATSAFGGQFDSFADFVIFGMGPAFLVFFRLRADPAWQGAASWVLLSGCALYVLAAAVRLARFNITTPPLGDSYFYGAATTLAGAFLASYYLSFAHQGWPQPVLYAMPFLLVVAALLMVSNLLVPKLKRRNNVVVNVLQTIDVILIYVFVPLRIFPEFILASGLTYFLVGAGYCLIKGVDRKDAINATR